LEAIAAGPLLRELGVAVVEQPVAAGDDGGQARVATVYAEQHQIGVIADERVRSPADVHAVAVTGAAHCVNVGVSKMGGIVAAFDAATTARSAYLGVAVGSVVELGVATAAGVQLAAALPVVSYPSYLIGSRKYERQITWPPLEVVDSRLASGTAPGLGVEVDEKAVAAMALHTAIS
jgi:L-alanine-DL-glutamate epimerase-like enolase superfamily enzyme